jgi:cob(I)alamin adenosyltransferase
MHLRTQINLKLRMPYLCKMSFKIYTKTGDEGKTGLIGGTRITKAHIRIEAYGTVDELNSYIGVVADSMSLPLLKPILKEIQDRLFTIGSSLATDPEKEIKMRLPDLLETDIEYLEHQIDAMNLELPELRSFILVGGHLGASHAHVARCICRRAERICVQMHEDEQFIAPLVIKYLNRLSDYLFTIARYIGFKNNAQELEWHPRVTK